MLPVTENAKLGPFFSLSSSLQTISFSLRSIHVDLAEQGSEEQGNKDMDAFNKVMDKVKSHPEVVEKVKDEVKNLADALHLHRHHGKTSDLPLFLGLSLAAYLVALVIVGTFASSFPWTGSKDKESESEAKAEPTQNVDNGAPADKAEESNVLEQAVEEIQAVVAAVQQQQTTPTAETGTVTPTETAATAETSPEGEKPEETNREVEKDDPKKRLDFLGFFAMLFERFCSPANKKKD